MEREGIKQAISRHLIELAENNPQHIFSAIIEKVGTFGKYQRITIFFWCMTIFFHGHLVFSIPFLFYQDPYECSSEVKDCRDYVCSLPQNQRSIYIPQASFNSLINEMGDYRCPEQQVRSNSMIAFTFFGIVLGYLMMTLLGQMISKRFLMIANFSCFVIGVLLVLLFSSSEVMVTLGLMMGVLGSSNCYIITFMFLIETMDKKTSERYSVVIQNFHGFGAVVAILSFWIIKDWWLIFFFCYLVPSVTLLIYMYSIIVDTPMSLILRNEPIKALEELSTISKMNHTDDNLTLEDIIEAKERYLQSISQNQTKTITVIDIFRYKSTRNITILLILLQCTISFEFYAPSLMLGSFKYNMFINGLAIGVPQIIANLLAQFTIRKYKRRAINISCFGCALVTSFLLIFVWDQNGKENDSSNTNLATLALIFIFQFAITKQYTAFYVYLNEAYSTQARMIAISIISLMGGLMAAVTSLIIGYCLENEFHVMIIFTILSGLCILISFYLPETFEKETKEMIEELQQWPCKQFGLELKLVNNIHH